METFKIILPLGAILISIITIFITKRNFRRQIRVAKLEEMMENFLYVSSYYFHLKVLLVDLIEILNEKESSPENYRLGIAAHRKNILQHQEKKTFETLVQKMSRVNFLSNSYLPNGELKFRIHATTSFIRQIIETLDCENLIPAGKYIENLPHHKEFSRFIDKIQKQLILEMDLGFQSMEWDKFREYLNTNFIKDVKA